MSRFIITDIYSLSIGQVVANLENAHNLQFLDPEYDIASCRLVHLLRDPFLRSLIPRTYFCI